MKRPNIKALTAKVDAWNASNKIGVDVAYRRDNGKATLTKTRTEAQVLSGHTAVIWLDDVSGCVDLSRVNAIESLRVET
jgi:hypothetical protein